MARHDALRERGSRPGPISRANNYIGIAASESDIDFRVVGRPAPFLAGDLAYRLFSIPRASEYRSHDHDALVRRARYHLRDAKMLRLATHVGGVVAYELIPDDGIVRGNVLVVHGWTSEASFMMGLAEPLRRSGFRVVLVDFPAHGRSREDRTTLVACARAVVEVADALGPFGGVVAHSMGALAALLAGVGHAPLPHAVAFERYCLIAAPNKFSQVTERFARRLGICQAARRQFERHLARIAHMPISDFCGQRFLRIIRRPTLLIHAPDDRDVPFHNAEEMAGAVEEASLLSFEGLGHRRILYAPPVVRAVVSFMR